MKFIPILDAGHGGVINNVYYCRAGGRKVITQDYAYYEGESNRGIVGRIAEKLTIKKIPFYVLAPEYTDTSLTIRALRANKIYQKNRNVYVASFHSNAGGGTGFEIWTSKGETPSDKIASYFGDRLQTSPITDGFKLRSDFSDGDVDKESNFTILRKTDCPAVLFENLFFDNPNDLVHLLDANFRDDIASFYVSVMKDLYMDAL